MKRLLTLTVLSLGLAAGSLLADDAAKPSTEAPKHPKAREELLKRFDANGDGKLDETERAAAREAGRELKEKHPKLGKKAEQKLLEKFDANKDGKLDETEKAAAKKWREEHSGKGQKGAAGETPAATETPAPEKQS